MLPSPSPALFSTPLATSRATYDTLRARYLRAPDGRWAADVSVPAGAVLVETGKGRPAGHDLGKNNPLSLEEEVSTFVSYRIGNQPFALTISRSHLVL